MKSLEDIRKFYPEGMPEEPMFFLREYLQYEILKILFQSKFGPKFTFLGGTCLRLCYHTDRFSEDLDFDNVGLTEAEFEEASGLIKRGLELLGYKVNIRFIYKGAFHCYIKFPSLLYHYNLSGHKEAKLLIKLDTEKQHYEYQRNIIKLNKFGVQTDVRSVPIELLGSQKVAAIMGRKRAKGRDYYDLVFILQRTALDYGYLSDRFEISTPDELRAMVAERIAPFNFELLAKDVAKFLTKKENISYVLDFPNYWKTVPL